MTAEVIDILSKQPHLEGACVCLHCHHTWHGVAPLGYVYSLECPECSLNKGVFSNLVFPLTEQVLTCACDNYHFIVRIDGSKMCSLCGAVYP